MYLPEGNTEEGKLYEIIIIIFLYLYFKKSFFNFLNYICAHECVCIVHTRVYIHSSLTQTKLVAATALTNLDSTLVLCRSTLEMTANDGNPPFLHPRHMLDQVNLRCCCWYEWLRTTNMLWCPIVSRHSILVKIERLWTGVPRCTRFEFQFQTGHRCCSSCRDLPRLLN